MDYDSRGEGNDQQDESKVDGSDSGKEGDW